MQVNVTVVQPSVDAGLTLSSALRQSVTSGQLGSAISSAVGYDVSVSSDTDNQMYILAEMALTQAQASAGLTSKGSVIYAVCVTYARCMSLHCFHDIQCTEQYYRRPYKTSLPNLPWTLCTHHI